MRIDTPRGYKPEQIVRLGLVVLILLSSFGWAFMRVQPAQAQGKSLAPAATAVSKQIPGTSKISPTGNGSVQFSSAAYTTTEGVSGTTITGTRTGDTGPLTALILLTDVTTSASDYQFTITPAGTLGNFLNPGAGTNSTSLTLTSDANPSQAGQNVTFTASLNPNDATGIVTFTIDSSTVVTATLANGVATYTTSSLSFGSHSIIATYGEDALYDGATASLTQQVNSDSTLSFSNTDYTATEGAAGTTVTINRGGSGAGPITATVVINDSTTLPSDYQSSNPTIAKLDTTFNSGGSGANDSVYAIAQKADGHIIIGGRFSAYNGISRSKLAQLNSDGSLDTSFNFSGNGPDAEVLAITIQPDGKILVGGNFSTYNGIFKSNLVRLNSDGSLDTSFNSGGSGLNNAVLAITIQPDDKILIGGFFSTYNGTSRNYLARLNSDGSLDTSFTTAGTGFSDPVYGIAVQSDGKILVGGTFTSYNGTDIGHLGRLNADGSLDTSFNSGEAGANGDVYSIVVQSDNKILIGGYFGSYDNSTDHYLVRLTSDGSLDSSFHNDGTGPNDLVEAIVTMSDGGLLIAGNFAAYNGVSVPHLARLHEVGGLTFSWPDGDTSSRSFVITATDDTLSEATETANLSLTDLQGGAVTTSPDTATLSIIDNDPAQINLISGNNQNTRVNTDFGQPLEVQVLTQAGDPVSSGIVTFTAPASGASGKFANGSTVYTGTTDASGYITTTTFTANSVVGSYTVSATTTSTTNSTSFSLSNDKGYGSVNLVSSANSINYQQSVTFTATVSPASATGTLTFTIDNRPVAVITLSNNIATYVTNTLSIGTHVISAIYGGDTNYYGGVVGMSLNEVVNTNSTLSFSSSVYTATEGTVGTIVTITRGVSSSGAIMASVVVSDITTSAADYQLPLSAGAIDTTFNTGGSGPNQSLTGIKVQPDGKILIAGSFTTYNGVARPGLARVNTDGSLDTSFVPAGSGPNHRVLGITVQTNGKILIGGEFTSYNGVARPYLARLNTDGSLDTSFAPAGTGPNALIEGLALQTDGKILIAGSFSSYNGVAVPGLARLNADGTLDTSFNTGGAGARGAGGSSGPAAVGVQSNGKIVVGGFFTSYNGVSTSSLIRLNTDGSLDTSFALSGYVNGYVEGIAVQANDKIVIVGPVTGQYNGFYFKPVVRLNSDGSLDTSYIPTGNGTSTNMLAVGVQADGNILIGPISTFNGVSAGYLVRLYGANGLGFNWADGDSSPRSFIITATHDTIAEPTETAELDLQVQSGVTAGSPNTAILSILDNYPSQITAISGGNQSVAATTSFIQPLKVRVLTSNALPATSVIVTFTAPTSGASGKFVNNSTVYTGTTDASGYITTSAFTANSVTGSYNVTATANGIAGSVSFSLTNTAAPCQPLVVTSVTDDGKGTSCGTLSYALSQPVTATASSPVTITFVLSQGSTITFTGSLTTTAKVKAYVVLYGGAFGSSTRVTINGNGVSGDGLHLAGHNYLVNLTIKSFGARELVLEGTGNRFQGLVVIAS